MMKILFCFLTLSFNSMAFAADLPAELTGRWFVFDTEYETLCSFFIDKKSDELASHQVYIDIAQDGKISMGRYLYLGGSCKGEATQETLEINATMTEKETAIVSMPGVDPGMMGIVIFDYESKEFKEREYQNLVFENVLKENTLKLKPKGIAILEEGIPLLYKKMNSKLNTMIFKRKI